MERRHVPALLLVATLHAVAIRGVVGPEGRTSEPPQLLTVTWLDEAAPATPAAPPPPAARARPATPAPVAMPARSTERMAAGVPASAEPGADTVPPVAATAGTAAPAVTPASFDAAYLRNPPPAYPALSRRLGEQGKVELRVFVSAEGAAETIEIRHGSGHLRLDEAALEAVRRWRFAPARRGDTAIGAWVVVPVLFQLQR